MIKKVILILKVQPIFFASFIILSFIIGLTQYQFWFGDFSRSDLQILKEDIALVEIFHEYLKTKSKVVVENLIKQEKMFTINENFFGKNYLFLVAPLHPNSWMHPVYKWGQVVNLSANIAHLLENLLLYFLYSSIGIISEASLIITPLGKLDKES